MSGGTWNYQNWKVRGHAEVVQALLVAVAEAEHIVDWSEAGDTSREDAERDLYDHWVRTFDEIFGR